MRGALGRRVECREKGGVVCYFHLNVIAFYLLGVEHWDRKEQGNRVELFARFLFVTIHLSPIF